jgi:hypothetical protein
MSKIGKGIAIIEQKLLDYDRRNHHLPHYASRPLWFLAIANYSRNDRL